MTRIDEIRERLDKATPGPWLVWDDGDVGTAYPVTTRTRDGRVIELESKHIANSDRSDADLIANAPADLAWCLGEIGRLRTQLNALTEECNESERSEQEVTDVLQTAHAMCLHGDPQQQIAEYIEQQDPGYQATKKEN